ncbi:hypothetical protein BTVI_94323 [Pitangus sulphuratus]|nr:hypothetical protein BTVI_94323 [Pitangus sulphuratus]
MTVDGEHPRAITGTGGESREMPMSGQSWRQLGMNGKMNDKADEKVYPLNEQIASQVLMLLFKPYKHIDSFQQLLSFADLGKGVGCSKRLIVKWECQIMEKDIEAIVTVIEFRIRED